MKVDIDYSVKPKFMLAKVIGDVKDQTKHLEYLIQVYETSKKNEKSYAIIDERKLIVHSSIVTIKDLITLVKIIVKEKFAKKVAMVVRKERFDMDENLAKFYQKMGFNTQIFLTIKDAEAWILE